MACFACVHHMEMGVLDGPGTVDILKNQFTFSLRATRFTPAADQWLLVKKDTRFLVTSLKCADREKIQNDPYLINWASEAEQTSPATGEYRLPSKDSVFNIAFEVKDLDASLCRLNKEGVSIPKPARTERDASGSIRALTVKSCVGDIHHTLLYKGDYSGYFLPGFTEVGEDESSASTEHNISVPDSLLQAFDHAAISVEMNTSMAVIGWYERCFGMKRFLINGDEDDDQGLILSTEDVGLRLRAMEYWKCAEVGLLTQESTGSDTVSRLSMVVSEGLPPIPGSTEENQIEAWMRKHGGPGIQHVAIISSDIKTAVRNLKQCGADFAAPPPPAYYTKVGRLDDIIQAGEDVETLRSNGILIDREADGIHDTSVIGRDEDKKKDSYLLQIFTKPMLKTDPFFMEIIQREGASGFGSGNVAALYRSVQAFIISDEWRGV